MADAQTKVYRVLYSVPRCRVVTYGQLAGLSGMPNGARSVARVLKALPTDTQVPWHRVVNASGRISLPEPGAAVQRERLESEGVVFLNGRISLKQFQWQP